MNNTSKSAATGRRILWAAGIACVACCAAPLAGLAFGTATVAALSAWSDAAALGAAGLGLAAYGAWRWTHRRAPQCDLDGPCAPEDR